MSFAASSIGGHSGAVTAIQERINSIGDPIVRAWLKAELAEYTHPINAVDEQEIMKSAHSLNWQLPRPLSGVDYQKLAPLSGEQAKSCILYDRERVKNANELVLAANAVADELAFRPDSYRRLHRAMREAAFLLGLDGRLPESEFGVGPDVLWAVGGLRYFVIECKHEATADTVCKKDCNQLGSSVNWFGERYDKTCRATPILIHPSPASEYAATPAPGTRVMAKDSLPKFTEAPSAFCLGLSGLPGFGSATEVAQLHGAHKLLPNAILETYTVAPKSS